MKLKFIIFIIFSILIERLVQSILFDDNSTIEIPDQNWKMVKIQKKSIDRIFFSKNDESSIKINYYLYTHKNIDSGQIVIYQSNKTLRNSNFDPKNPTRFLIHGYTGDKRNLQDVKSAYLKNGNKLNIFMVDWSSVAKNPNYIYATIKTFSIGNKIAKFLMFLHDVGKMPYETLYLIGHSLGAHIAGIAGKKLLHGRINTIFGLDPAGPLFSRYSRRKRLARTDADYVETIHTNTGKFGFAYPIGIASFYPNYGKKQPGCALMSLSCSHTRALSLFIESISNKNNFIPTQCKHIDDVDAHYCTGGRMNFKMGGEPSNYRNHVRGIYYLPTNSESPFGLG